MPKRKQDKEDVCPCGPHVLAPHIYDCNKVFRIVKELSKRERPKHKCPPSPPPLRVKRDLAKEGALRAERRGCVPIVPPLHTRMRLHCPRHREESSLMEEMLAEEVHMQCPARNVKFGPSTSGLPCPVIMPKPLSAIRHSPSDRSILRVGSPTQIGDVPLRTASLTPSEHRPPVPSGKDFSLQKPHSGLYINVTADFVPSAEDLAFPPQRKRRRKQSKRPPCLRERRGNYKKAAQKRKYRRKRGEGESVKLSTCKSYVTMGTADRKSRYERSTQKHLLDDESTCSADGILETLQQVRIPKNVKKGTMQTHSLTVIPCPCRKAPDIHFGILKGKLNIFDGKYGARSRGQQAVTVSVISYCFAFHCHPKQWTVELIDNLLDNGDRWYLQCLDKLHDHSAVQGICEVLPYGKKHTLILNGKRMQVLLQEPDVVGYTMSLDPTQYNLCRGLKVFFKANRAALFLSRILKVVIWKDKICYYIFDPAGRDDSAKANSKDGKAALMNVKDLEGVTEVLLARSVIEDQKYVLSALKVLKMVDEDSLEDFGSEHEMTPAERAMAEYRLLSETCAIVNANLHLGDACFEQAKFRQALPVAIVAITYSKISPPNTWNSKSLDKVLRLGSKLFLDCSHPDVLTDLTIDNIPTDIDIGPFTCEIIIYRDRVKGQLFTEKGCLLNIELGLKEFFSKEYNCGILQFNIYSLAVWRQREMYYMFDPYPCSNDGLKAINGKACVLMHLHPESIADAFTKSWDYLPATTQFQIHACKVLKLKKNQFKANICSMSDDDVGGLKSKRRLRKRSSPCLNRGDPPKYIPKDLDEEDAVVHGDNSGDITSLVDTIQEEDVPPIPLQYKVMGPEPQIDKLADVDSPTISATQIVPAPPKSRDKTNEPPEPDPDPEPEPPTPPVIERGEGGGEEEQMAEEEEEVESEKEEENVETLPPPPPSPEPEPELAPPEMTEDEAQTQKLDVHRTVLETSDAYFKYKLRDRRESSHGPLDDDEVSISQSEEMMMPSNFKDIPDSSQLIYGSKAITDDNIEDVLPFVSIIAIVTSYKYKINSWSKGIVDFVVETGLKLHENKTTKFKFAPVHFIPRIAIGTQAYEAYIEVACDGATWQLETTLCKYFQRHDRGMISTACYSCAVFKKNGLYYLFDGSACNGVGLRDCSKIGNAVFMRFITLHALVHRILYNKDGDRENQQFILSRVWVKRLIKPLRERLPDSGDKANLIPDAPPPPKEEPRTPGYKRIKGVCRILGTTGLKARSPRPGVKECHFIGTVAMLLLAMHPIRTWDYRTIDAAVESGMDIYGKACNLKLCERRVIKNILLEGSFFNIAIKKVNVVNKNAVKTLEQYLKAVLAEMRYVMIRYPEGSMVIYRDGGNLHLFDPYPPPSKEQPEDSSSETVQQEIKEVASWTLYKSLDALVQRIKMTTDQCTVNEPMFYSYELTSVKKAPKKLIFNYKLSHLFRPDANPYTSRMSRRKKRALAKCQLAVVDEEINWTNMKEIPWSRNMSYNGLGYPRKTMRTMWRDWDIEFPADLYSLWGTISPHSPHFSEENRGKQILAINTVAIAMTKYYEMSEWTSNVLDACVCYGDKYHTQSMESISNAENHEIVLSDLDKKFEMYPYTFSVLFEKEIFGTVYNIHRDSMNLCRALIYFFERCKMGILVCHSKNLAFGLLGKSYFMFDCQSFGPPTFPPGQGGGYVLKCESLNRLLFCMIVTLNIKRHGVEFTIYTVEMNVSNISG